MKIDLTSILLDREDEHLFGECNWYISPQGYVTSGGNTNLLFKDLLLHRVVLGAKKGQFVDHINGNKLDNRRQNLRLCNQSQNGANTKMRKNNTSGYKGVTWITTANKWKAQIMINRKMYNLGLFGAPEEANLAYKTRALLEWGEFAK